MSLGLAAVSIVILGWEARALADPALSMDEASPPGTVLAPKNALELQFDLGYTQPFGKLTEAFRASDVAHAGFGSGGALAWRLTPHLALAGYGAFHQSSADANLNNGMVFGGAGGIRADYHILPYRLVDPYVSAGTGYRLLFLAPGGPTDNHMLHGFEALNTNAGVDFRVSKNFAIGPMLGADVNVFLWDLDEHTGVNSRVANKSVSTFFFAGVGGKLDVLGKRVSQHEAREAVPAAGEPSVREVKPR